MGPSYGGWSKARVQASVPDRRLSVPVQLGAAARLPARLLPARLLAVRVPGRVAAARRDAVRSP